MSNFLLMLLIVTVWWGSYTITTALELIRDELAKLRMLRKC